jgi:hypothetical protein
MKNPPILFIAFLFSTISASSLNLKDALASHQIAVEVSGSNYDSMPTSLRKNGFSPEMQMTVSWH